MYTKNEVRITARIRPDQPTWCKYCRNIIISKFLTRVWDGNSKRYENICAYCEDIYYQYWDREEEFFEDIRKIKEQKGKEIVKKYFSWEKDDRYN